MHGHLPFFIFFIIVLQKKWLSLTLYLIFRGAMHFCPSFLCTLPTLFIPFY